MTKVVPIRQLITAVMAVAALSTGISTAQQGPNLSDWQLKKCEIYRQGWDTALDFFGSDDLNYNFIAQNENFIASGCTAPPSICAQSNQELEIANALTIAMMNAGAASTFLPFRCQDSGQAQPTEEHSGPSVDTQLCRSQLELLLRGHKLTQEEASVFEAQCACLEQKHVTGAQTDCAQ